MITVEKEVACCVELGDCHEMNIFEGMRRHKSLHKHIQVTIIIQCILCITIIAMSDRGFLRNCLLNFLIPAILTGHWSDVGKA